MRDQFLDEARREPVKYFKHDVNAHDDEALYRFAYENGMAYYGLYWLLVELLTARRGHSYDVSDAAGWRRMAVDMSALCDMSVDECKKFVGALDKAHLISHEHLAECQKVAIKRINADSEAYAESVVAHRMGSWKTNKSKAAKR